MGLLGKLLCSYSITRMNAGCNHEIPLAKYERMCYNIKNGKEVLRWNRKYAPWM